mmetsp:Transcript_68456/g.222750  ORF Transcript_68456/g.222750 Transcript_68456/m.222750 type:complete len:215 (-) Transcript_68456:783-1427(-)
MRDRFDIKAAGADICGEEKPHFPRGELGEVLVALVLSLVAVEGCHLEASAIEGLRVLLDSPLRVHEGDELGVLGEVGDDPPEFHLLVLVANLEELLRYGLVRRELFGRAHVHMHVLRLKVAVRDALHCLRPGRGEHQRLPDRGTRGYDLGDLGLEAHVQHPVGLVEHQKAHVFEVDRRHLHEVLQAPGCRDQHLRVVLAGFHLRPLGSASEYRQ